MKIFNYCFIMLLILTIMTGCIGQNQEISEKEEDNINIVVTTTMLADLTKIIGGEHVDVSGLMPPGVDPHQFEASAGNISDMQKSDLIIYNGLHLEGKMGDVFEHMKEMDKKVISMDDYIHTDLLIKLGSGNENIYDPHIWFDPKIWNECAVGITNELGQIDTENAGYYQNNLQNYQKELKELDIYIKTKIQETNQHNHILITAHDAFGYFGKAYDFQVVGLQGVNTNAEISTSDIKDLSDFIIKNKVKSIFLETSIPTKTVEALKDSVKTKGFNVEIGGQLYSDSIGGEGSNAQTYILAYKHNIDTIIDSLY